MPVVQTFKGRIQETDNSLGWHFFIPVPDEIVKKLADKNNKRVVCTFNEKVSTQIALTPIKGHGYTVILNTEIRKKLKVKPGDLVDVSLEKDNSEYGIATPVFFKEFCNQDPDGSAHFHALTIGKQRTLLHLISKIKSENKQLEKAWVIFDYLKSSNGKLDFKELNEAFKNSRFKTY